MRRSIITHPYGEVVMRLRTICCAVAFVLGCALPAVAQLTAIEALTKNVTALGVYTLVAKPKAESLAPGGHWSGYGLELSYEIFTATRYKDVRIRNAVNELEQQKQRLKVIADSLAIDTIKARTAELEKALVAIKDLK